MKTVLKFVCALAGVMAGVMVWCASAYADVAITSKKLEVAYWAGALTDQREASLSRLTLAPSLKLRFNRRWQSELKLRAEYASDNTGLGSLETYSRASRPLVDGDEFRVELDRATLTRRTRGSVLTLGKQTVPWGVLDGVQVTDRFDAVRRRDFVLTDARPERIARWGLRWRSRFGGVRVDVAALADPTATQLAQAGDAFEPLAPRLRGGLTAAAPTLPIQVASRGSYTSDATLGLRFSRTFGDVQASVLTLSGPDTDPLLRFRNGVGTPVVELDYPRRRMHGVTLEAAVGDAVVRFEAAAIPDQAVNVLGASPLQTDERRRWLAGVGVDVRAFGGWFLNAQLAADRVEDGALPLARPRQDVVATLRAQRAFGQDTLTLKAELLGTISDRDGVFRPVVEWQAHSNVRLSVGGDFLFGDREGLFGQYRDESRVWLRLRFSI